MKIFVAIPCYDGKIATETVRALLNEHSAAGLTGDEIQFGFLAGSSLITHARNQLARDFLVGDCERLVFVDADVAWNCGELLKLARHDADLVGGAYRFKEDVERYPVAWIEERENLHADPRTGLLEVRALPGGFLGISREVFRRLAEAHPGRAYQHGGQAFHAFFHCPPGDGEDGAFCTDWRALGGQVWLDPELKLIHVGGNIIKYEGRIGDWLRAR